MWVSEAEMEAMGGRREGGPVVGRLVGEEEDDDACSGGSEVGSEGEQADADADGQGEEEKESLDEKSTALMEEALNELTEAIRQIEMRTLLQMAKKIEKEMKSLDNFPWGLDLL